MFELKDVNFCKISNDNNNDSKKEWTNERDVCVCVFGCQYMDICFYCYFLFSCVHNSLDFMKRIECGEQQMEERKNERIFLRLWSECSKARSRWSLMCNRTLLSDNGKYPNLKHLKKLDFWLARLLSIGVKRARNTTRSHAPQIVTERGREQRIRMFATKLPHKLKLFFLFNTFTRKSNRQNEIDAIFECEHL